MSILTQEELYKMKTKLSSKVQEVLEQNLDEKGDLTCAKAFKVARLIPCEPKEMANISKSLDIKISACRLGIFGDLGFGTANQELLKKIKNDIEADLKKDAKEDEKQEKINYKITCEKAWEYAKQSSLKEVGATLKNSDIKISTCQLGCFGNKKKDKNESKS